MKDAFSLDGKKQKLEQKNHFSVFLPCPEMQGGLFECVFNQFWPNAQFLHTLKTSKNKKTSGHVTF